MKRPILIGVSAGLVVLIAVLVFMYAQQQSRAQFDGIERALKAVQVATSMGVNNSDFHHKVEALATEYALLQGKVGGGKAKTRLEGYGRVVIAYQDSVKLWDVELSSDVAEERNSIADLQKDMRDFKRLEIQGYHLPHPTAELREGLGNRLIQLAPGEVPAEFVAHGVLEKYHIETTPLGRVNAHVGVQKIWSEADKQAAQLPR